MSIRGAFAVLSALVVSAAPAAADTLESLYGNTLVITYPSGNVERFHVDEDGAFTMLMQGGAVRAQWAMDGDQFCVSSEGAPMGCSPFPMDKAVGDAWEQETPEGVVRYEIAPGRD